jgi:hypothetical protein
MNAPPSPRAARTFAVVALAVSIGCGGQTAIDATSDAGGDAGASGDAAGVNDAACSTAARALGTITTDRYCTTVVRLSTIDRSILGWSIACGPLKPASEADARAAFATHLPPETTAVGFTRVGPTDGTHDYVFFQSPGDFGGIGIVSFATSTLVFSGKLIFLGTSGIVYPSSFRPASEIPTVCAETTLPDVQGVPIFAPPDPNEVAAVATVVGRSALVPALAGHALVHTLVALFPVSTGATVMDPPHDEWLVVIDSSLLE